MLLDRGKAAVDEAYRDFVRFQCQTDILFLARILGYDKINDRVHRPIADACVRKHPDKPIEEQDSVKEFLHLDPRGVFKSTLSITDSVQWIICFPNVRICKLTATKPLAKAIADEITGHFVKDLSAEPTDFQLLFPEFCITPKDRKSGEYTAPNRTREWREATVMAFSNETTISGWHFDVIDPDDVVDTLNSSTATGIAKQKKNWRINKKTLMPWGYINYKGTRYNPFDLWGDIIEKARPGKIRLINRAALIVKSGDRLEAGKFPAEDEVELLFPELLPYEFLRDAFEDDYDSFMTQYMNDAHGANEVIFSKEILLAASIPAEQASVAGEVHIAWRFAYSGKNTMKYTGAAVGLMSRGRMQIIDAVKGSFKPSSLAHEVVKLAKKHGTHNVTIEETPGAKYNDATIQNYAATMGWPLQIRWVEFQEDDAVRDLRIKATEPLLTTKRLILSDSIPCLSDAMKQFINFGMIDDRELVDVISRVSEILPRSIVPDEQNAEQELNWELLKQRDMYNRTHGIGQYAPPEPLIEEKPYEVPQNNYGLDNMLPGLNG